MTKTKKQSLRSRLRDDAATELHALTKEGERVLARVSVPAGITSAELAKMIGSTQIDTLVGHLVTRLADRKEAALEKLYTEQQEAQK